jgi:hypothetical protein
VAFRQFIDNTLAGPISLFRRQIIAIILCAAASIGALFYFLAAANLALETIVGPVASRAIIGLVFTMIAIVAILIPRLFRSESIVEKAKAQTQDMTREEKFTLIMEAILAGFSLSSSRRSQASK